MNIQSLSIVVPTKGCVNKCKFCVSRMHENEYPLIDSRFNLEKRLKFAVNNGVNTCIITGTGEPFQNIKFMKFLLTSFERMNHPFPNVEFQTSGVFLAGEGSKENIFLLKELGVNTISLSISSLFDNKNNMNIIGVPEKLRFSIFTLVSNLKSEGFNVRFSLNMTNEYDNYSIEEILEECKALKADQVTFRKLYFTDKLLSKQDEWVRENSCKEETFDNIKKYITGYEDSDGCNHTIHRNGNGTLLYKLPFGATVYSIKGMSIVIDDDCMAKESNEALKYIILRENGKLYCRWDDDGSLIF